MSIVPKSGKIKKVKTNNDLGITEWTLNNGLKVVLKQTDFKDDEILLFAYSNGGLSTINNIEDMPSAEMSTAVVRNNGLGEFNQVELSKLLTGKIVDVTPFISNNEEILSGSSSIKDFETLMQLSYLYFTGAREDDKSFRTLMNLYNTYLKNSASDPNSAFKDSIRVVTANHNPYVKPFDLERLAKVDQHKALEIFKDRFQTPSDFTFFIVGNINEKEIKPLILTYLGGLDKGKKEKSKWVDKGIRKPKGLVENKFEKELKVDKSSNYIMYSGDMDYNLRNKITLGIIRDILNIRYLESLREEEGGTYGVRVRTDRKSVV